MNYDISKFKVGQVVKMDVARRSHVKNPYYVLITHINPDVVWGGTIMRTFIPGEHYLDMMIGNNWDYHYPRMTVIGDQKDFYHLLLNQKLI